MAGSAIGRQEMAEHTRYLRNYALRHVRDPDLAADLVQETFVAALSAGAAFEGRSTLRTWLVGILRHKIFDALRRRGHAELSLEALAEQADPERGDAGVRATVDTFAAAASAPSPEDSLTRAQFVGAFERHLGRLSSRAARAFLLSEVLGHSTSEVCGMLGMTPACLWTTVHRARKAIRAGFPDASPLG